MKNCKVKVELMPIREMLATLVETNIPNCHGTFMDRKDLYKETPWFYMSEDGDIGFAYETSCVSDNNKLYPVITLDEMVKEITKVSAPVIIHLNSDHDAIVKQDGSVEVGCQKFSAKVILELADAVKKAIDK
jgi:hypothetical protein